ncbi:zinc-finger domain-containing protein [Acetobacter musti]|uniref:Zinc-finger domain-containing protein n=1 Tax=Acetobacter musti TaxID=864732 RepID=A0ABX0JVZ6_9PROT|nr:zinc-finger domain-containing protein [Acetobacter musti]NHN86150.1 zinc-finger domain-containing protein [Acetobacter musti]
MLIQPANPSPRPRLGHVETVIVQTHKISCDGGLGALGHPRVWLKIGGHQTFCPYCSRLFVVDPNAEPETGH